MAAMFISGPTYGCVATDEGPFRVVNAPPGATYSWYGGGDIATGSSITDEEVKLSFRSSGSWVVGCTVNGVNVVEIYFSANYCFPTGKCENKVCGPNQYCENGVCKDHALPGGQDSPKTESFPVEVQDCAPYIGTVTITGATDVCLDPQVNSTYYCHYTGNAPNPAYQWFVYHTTGGTNPIVVDQGRSVTGVKFKQIGINAIVCAVTDSSASDDPQVSDHYQVDVKDCNTDPCDGVTCGPDEYCDNGVCKPVDPCQGVTCPTGQICVDGNCEPDPNYNPCDGVVCPDGEVCVNGVCQPTGGGGGGGADDFHYRYPNQFFTSRQDTQITTLDTEQLNDYEKGIGRTTSIDRTLDKKVILPPDFNPNP